MTESKVSIDDSLELPADRKACRPHDVHVDETNYRIAQEATRRGLKQCFVTDSLTNRKTTVKIYGQYRPRAFLDTGEKQEFTPDTQGRIEAIAVPIANAVIQHCQRDLSTPEFREWYAADEVHAIKNIVIPPVDWSLRESRISPFHLPEAGDTAFDSGHRLYSRNVFILRVFQRINILVNDWLKSVQELHSIFSSVTVSPCEDKYLLDDETIRNRRGIIDVFVSAEVA